MNKLQDTVNHFKQEVKVYQLVLKDKRTPKASKFMLGLAVSYAVCPFDIIPDFIPVFGYLDDLIIIPLLVYIAITITPKGIIEDCRNKAKE
ncbi:MAG: DUF1232 domain-containing protein [Candidatus Omnitrophica bacterium]|nr:DUF1232 domain-containing protein [Candidatus Omnitrophota bacterium]